MSFFENVAIGGTAGIVSRTLTAPLDLYKIQLQNPYMYAKTPMEVVRKEGIRHLWKGNLSNCLRVLPQQAISYPVYHGIVSTPLSSYPSYMSSVTTFMTPSMHTFLAGFAGGGVATLVTYPLETLRCRLSLQQHGSHYKGIAHAFRTTPMHAWYQGLGVSMIGFPIFNAFTFLTYQTLSQSNALQAGARLMDRIGSTSSTSTTSTTPNRKIPESIQKLVYGGLSGMVAVTITYPTDLVRRRMQLQGFDKQVPQYATARDAVRMIVREQGVKGLYRGLGMCYLKLFPASGIQFYVYHTLHTYLARVHTR